MTEFEKNGGLITVLNGKELLERLTFLFGSKEERKKMGSAALTTIENNRGTTEKLTDLLETHISGIVS